MSLNGDQNAIPVVGVPTVAPQGPPNKIQPAEPKRADRGNPCLPGRPTNNGKLVRQLEKELTAEEKEEYQAYCKLQKQMPKFKEKNNKSKQKELFKKRMAWLVEKDGGDPSRRGRVMPEEEMKNIAKQQRKAEAKEIKKAARLAQNAAKAENIKARKQRQKEKRRQKKNEKKNHFNNGNPSVYNGPLENFNGSSGFNGFPANGIPSQSEGFNGFSQNGIPGQHSSGYIGFSGSSNGIPGSSYTGSSNGFGLNRISGQSSSFNEYSGSSAGFSVQSAAYSAPTTNWSYEEAPVNPVYYNGHSSQSHGQSANFNGQCYSNSNGTSSSSSTQEGGSRLVQLLTEAHWRDQRHRHQEIHREEERHQHQEENHRNEINIEAYGGRSNWNRQVPNREDMYSGSQRYGQIWNGEQQRQYGW